ncbi:MAG TPA: FadR/GntR family transcriptional regulator [Actinomycetes bacterium]|jgi:GntR family transcriptional repressor for pyruvate dehydrogenase complex|nr:FadR/GntR family transcriptional regulator [Actinomycetes bacterium]
MAVTDEAIGKIKGMIVSGELRPGDRLPKEADLAERLGLSRSSLREAVKALSLIRVLDVRQGDGTYVTSLEPGLLLEGVGIAVELLQGETLLEITEVRRLFEPVATGLAATRISADQLTEVKGHLDAMRESSGDVEGLIRYDAAFHRAVIAATGNRTLTTLLERISSQTLRARSWRGLVDANAAGRTLAEHETIYAALAAGDSALAQAAALLHVGSTEMWLRPLLTGGEPGTGATDLSDPPAEPISGETDAVPAARA